MQVLSEHLNTIVVLVGMVAWFVRLEFRVKYLEKDFGDAKLRLSNAEGKIENLDSATTKELTEVKVILARMEGMLHNVLKGDGK